MKAVAIKVIFSCGNNIFEQELEMGNPEAWSEMFDGNVEYITVKGKHFYLTEDFTPVSDAIKNIEKELMKGR